MILQKRLDKASKRLAVHYDFEQIDEGTRAETGQTAEDAGQPIQVIKKVTMRSQVNEFGNNNAQLIQPEVATGEAPTGKQRTSSKYESKAKRPS